MNVNPNSSTVKFNPRKEEGYKAPDDVKTRPTGENKPAKDFKKVLSKNEEEEEGDDAKSQGVEEAGAQASGVLGTAGKKKKPSSLFDLTSGGYGSSLDGDKKGVAKHSKSTFKSPSENLDQASQSNEGVVDAKEENPLEKELPFGGNKSSSDGKNKSNTRFGADQSDLTNINPMVAMSQQHPISTQNIGKQDPVVPAVNLQAIIDQLVEKTVQLKVSGLTETTVTLKQPPMFEGANIVLTSFDSAKNEFNISFQNLTQQAKNILDMQINRDSLLLSLEKKGYAVHILTATTVNEPRVNIATAPSSQEPNRERRDSDGRQQPRDQRRGG